LADIEHVALAVEHAVDARPARRELGEAQDDLASGLNAVGGRFFGRLVREFEFQHGNVLGILRLGRLRGNNRSVGQIFGIEVSLALHEAKLGIRPREGQCGKLFFGRDLFRKPVPTPDQVRGELFGITPYSRMPLISGVCQAMCWPPSTGMTVPVTPSADARYRMAFATSSALTLWQRGSRALWLAKSSALCL